MEDSSSTSLQVHLPHGTGSVFTECLSDMTVQEIALTYHHTIPSLRTLALKHKREETVIVCGDGTFWRKPGVDGQEKPLLVLLLAPSLGAGRSCHAQERPYRTHSAYMDQLTYLTYIMYVCIDVPVLCVLSQLR